jgi:hypothetical protein
MDNETYKKISEIVKTDWDSLDEKEFLELMKEEADEIYHVQEVEPMLSEKEAYYVWRIFSAQWGCSGWMSNAGFCNMNSKIKEAIYYCLK